MVQRGSGARVYRAGSEGVRKRDRSFCRVSLRDDDLDQMDDHEVLAGVDDCCTLNRVSVKAILHTLRIRFERGDIYTNIGDVLVVVNPFRALPMYSESIYRMYSEAADVSRLPPHIFSFCRSHFDIVLKGNSLSILTTGESGAGKTETTKHVVRYLSRLLDCQMDSVPEANTILECFGNAATTRNRNSSRYAKWSEAVIDPSQRTLIGLKVLPFIFEVTRICSQGPKERNFHVFYSLLQDAEIRERLHFEDAASATYLRDNPLKLEGFDDVERLAMLRKCLKTFGIVDGKDLELFDVLGSVIHLGNIQFEEGDEISIAERGPMNIAAKLLQVKTEELEKLLLYRKIGTNTECIMTPNTQARAVAARNSLAKSIYNSLFLWIAQRCNDAWKVLQKGRDDQEMEKFPFCGVLDVAGFEQFEKNSLEQLLINTSNERLHQLFNKAVFQTDLDDYHAEGFDMDIGAYTDNSDVCQLLENPKGGLLAILNDATKSISTTDVGFTNMVAKQLGNQKSIKLDAGRGFGFGISHSVGFIWYTTEGFLEKNVAGVPAEVLDLLASSGNSVVGELWAIQSKQESKLTPTSKYLRSLGELLQRVGVSSPKFIRCIKPNAWLRPHVFDSRMVLEQLRMQGTLQLVRIRKMGFQVRFPMLQFAREYMRLFRGYQRKEMLREQGVTILNENVPCEALGGISLALMKALGISSECYAIGKSKTFLKHGAAQIIQERLNFLELRTVVTIQQHWREALGRRQAHHKRYAQALKRFLFTTRCRAGLQMLMQFSITVNRIGDRISDCVKAYMPLGTREKVVEEGVADLNKFLQEPLVRLARKSNKFVFADDRDIESLVKSMILSITLPDVVAVRNVLKKASASSIRLGKLSGVIEFYAATLNDELRLLSLCEAATTETAIQVALEALTAAQKRDVCWFHPKGPEAHARILAMASAPVPSKPELVRSAWLGKNGQLARGLVLKENPTQNTTSMDSGEEVPLSPRVVKTRVIVVRQDCNKPSNDLAPKEHVAVNSEVGTAKAVAACSTSKNLHQEALGVISAVADAADSAGKKDNKDAKTRNVIAVRAKEPSLTPRSNSTGAMVQTEENVAVDIEVGTAKAFAACCTAKNLHQEALDVISEVADAADSAKKNAQIAIETAATAQALNERSITGLANSFARRMKAAAYAEAARANEAASSAEELYQRAAKAVERANNFSQDVKNLAEKTPPEAKDAATEELLGRAEDSAFSAKEARTMIAQEVAKCAGLVKQAQSAVDNAVKIIGPIGDA